MYKIIKFKVVYKKKEERRKIEILHQLIVER